MCSMILKFDSGNCENPDEVYNGPEINFFFQVRSPTPNANGRSHSWPRGQILCTYEYFYI